MTISPQAAKIASPEVEEYHQDYLEKNPGGYCHVDFGKL